MAETPLRTLVTELRTRLERERQTDRALDRSLNKVDDEIYDSNRNDIDDVLRGIEEALTDERLAAAEEESRRWIRESDREWARGRD